MFIKKQPLFVYPDVPMRSFVDVRKEIGVLPLEHAANGIRSLQATYRHDNDTYALSCRARTLRNGQSGAPLVIFLPWYGGKSADTRRLFGGNLHRDWECVGIDIFHTRKDFKQVLESAVGSQYAYALMLRMLAEQIQAAHAAHKRVGVVGYSYGANIVGAYVSAGLELPDAIAVVEGGSILDITLKIKYRGRDTDPRMLAALRQDPSTIPLQKAVTGKAAKLSAAVINPLDELVIQQEALWGGVANTLYIRGGHILAPLRNRGKIKRFIFEHLRNRLITQ